MTTNERLPLDGLIPFEAIVSRILRDQGSMSVKRADVLAHDVVTALDKLGWLNTPATADE